MELLIGWTQWGLGVTDYQWFIINGSIICATLGAFLVTGMVRASK
jgi:hypothetical protein